MPTKSSTAKRSENPGRAKAQPKAAAAPRDPARDLAAKATALATKGGSIKFGAPVSGTQIHDVQSVLKTTKPFKGNGILRALGCKERELKAYAQGDLALTRLPAKTREGLKSLSNGIDAICLKERRVNKTWPRKNAAILVTLAAQRPARKPKAKPAPTATPEPTAPVTA